MLYRAAGDVALVGTSYVGRAIVGRVAIDIAPKIPGTLHALLGYAAFPAFHVHRLPSQTSDPGQLIALVAAQFVDSVSSFASNGRPWEYQIRRFAGSLIGGRLDIRRTLAWRAKGSPHIAAFSRQVQSFDILENRVVAAALQQVDALHGLALMDAGYLEKARGLATVFDDATAADVVLRGPGHFLDASMTLAERADSEEKRDMFALASVLLSGESLEPWNARKPTAPRSWFIDLERLYERALLSVARVLVGPAGVTKGADSAPTIFSGSDAYTANPDLVFNRHAVAVAVADAKYKDISEGIKAPDLYQLLAHAAAFKVLSAALFFAGATTSSLSLGRSSSGCETWVCELDVSNLPESFATILSSLPLV